MDKKVKGKKGLTLSAKQSIVGYGFIAIWIVGFLAFTLYPTIYSVAMSLSRVQLTTTGMKLSWGGLFFYDYTLNTDLYFKPALAETLMFICCATPVIVVFALIIAMLLNGKFPLRTLFRGVFFLPVIVMSGPVISKLLTGNSVDLSSQAPLIENFINSLPGFIQKPSQFILNNLVIILWFSGVQILVFLAGLQKISPDIYEAASIDGASAWEKFWKITMPHVAPLALLCSIYTIVDLANYSGMKVNSLISERIFDQTRLYSFSAAMSWIYSLVILLLLAVVYLLFTLMGRRSKR